MWVDMIADDLLAAVREEEDIMNINIVHKFTRQKSMCSDIGGGYDNN